MNQMKKTAIFLIVIASFLGIFASCEKKQSDLQKIRLNEVVHSIFYAPQYVAMEKGFFEEEGIEIELSVGQGADKSMTALLSESADIALLGCEAGIYVVNEGKENYPISFAQLTQTAGNFLVSRENEESFTWSDLKGKTIIGGRVGGMPQVIFEYILKQNGLDIENDVEIINNLQFESTAGAFASGIGDYTVEFEPTASNLEKTAEAYVVKPLGTETAYIPYTVYMATPKYINENPELIQKFTNAIYKGQIWVDSHNSLEIAEVVLKHFPDSDLETLAKIIDRYKTQNAWKIEPSFDEAGFELIQDIMEDGKVLDKRVQFEDLINNDFAKKAKK